jgi:hypothetical protein
VWYQAWPPRKDRDYTRALSYLINRYRGAIRAAQIWHEPDLRNGAFFQGPHRAARYAQLLVAGYSAVKETDPSVTVLGGGLVGSNGRFLEQLYARGVRGHYDALSVDYYNLTLASLRSIRTVQRRHGDGAPLWLMELGLPVCAPGRRTPGGIPCGTPDQQALLLSDVFRGLADHQAVETVTIFDLFSAQFGILKPNLEPRPAFVALQSLLAGNPVRPRQLTAEPARGGGVRIQGTAPGGDVVVTDARRLGSSQGIQVVSAPDLRDRYVAKLGRRVLRGRWRIQVVQPWTGLHIILRLRNGRRNGP